MTRSSRTCRATSPLTSRRCRSKPYVEDITRLNDALKAELLKKPKDALSFDVLRAAQQNGQAMLLQTVARILGAFPGTGEDEKKRAALLEPIWRQNEDVRQSRRLVRSSTRRSPGTPFRR